MQPKMRPDLTPLDPKPLTRRPLNNQTAEKETSPTPPPPAEEKSIDAFAASGTRNAALETATKLSENVGGLEAQVRAAPTPLHSTPLHSMPLHSGAAP